MSDEKHLTPLCLVGSALVFLGADVFARGATAYTGLPWHRLRAHLLPPLYGRWREGGVAR